MLRNDDPLELWPDDWAANAPWRSFASHGDPVGQSAPTPRPHPPTVLVNRIPLPVVALRHIGLGHHGLRRAYGQCHNNVMLTWIVNIQPLSW